MIFSKGLIFGNREIVSESCTAEDFTKLGVRVPKTLSKHVLTRCGNCGKILPAEKRNLMRNPPKRCVYCSGIGNKFNVDTNRNLWSVLDNIAVCNVDFNGEVIQFTVDRDYYEDVSKHIWRISKKKQKYYVITGSQKKGTMIYLHQFIFGEVGEGKEIDHIDGNSLNNCIDNLREVTHLENTHNIRATRIDNAIGIRGIAYDKKSKKYAVDLTHNNNRYYVKPWPTLEQAVWCRHTFEDYFDLPMLKCNPLFEQYNTLSDSEKEEIKNYTLSKILGN